MTNPIRSGETILFIGDSITDAGRTNHLPPLGGGYVNMFRNLVMADHPESDLTIINKGISGNTLKGLELRWQKDVLDIRSDRLMIMIGINDAAMQLNSSRNDEDVLNEFEDTYKKLLHISLEKGMDILCMTPFFISKDSASPLLNMTLKYIDRIKKICSEQGVPLIDIHRVFQEKLQKSDPAFWSGDGVHPYEHGHMLIARELYKEMCNG